MPISTSLRKLLCCAPVGQEEEEAQAPARLPLPEPMEAAPGPARAERPHQEYVENEVDRMFREMIDDIEIAANDLEVPAKRQNIPLPEHPAPQHPSIHFSMDPDSGRPIPDENALIRGDYVYVLEDGSRITQDEYIHPWRSPGVFPTANDLRSRGWDACYSLNGEGAWTRLVYHWLTGAPGEGGITNRVDRLFTGLRTMHFSPRPPALAEAPARGEASARAEASATRPVPAPARQPAGRGGRPPAQARERAQAEMPAQAEASATRPVPAPARQPAGRGGRPPAQARERKRAEIPARAKASATRPVPETRQPGDRAGSEHIRTPLPEHPGTQHPPIYYRISRASGEAIPDWDSYIRRGYVRRRDGMQEQRGYGFKPWRASRWPVETDFGYIRRGRDYYTLELHNGEVSILLHFIPTFPRLCDIRRVPLDKYLFSTLISEEAVRLRQEAAMDRQLAGSAAIAALLI